MKRVLLVLATVGLLTVASPLQASQIKYIETATATGSLGALPFTNVLVTITLTSDTSTVSGSPGFFESNFGSATVNVLGVGTATFTDHSLWAFDNPSVSAAGISDVTQGFLILDTNNAAFTSYDLRSSIGPISGTAAFNSGTLFPTTLGNFALTSVGSRGMGITSTFTAINSAVPESPSYILVAAGLIGVVGAKLKSGRRRLNL